MQELEIAVAVLYTIDRTPEGKSCYRLLLEDRRSHPKYGEEWGFFGGKKEPEDRSIEDTLKREVKEELGIDLLRYIYLKDYQWNPTPDCLAKEHYYLAQLPPELVHEGEFVPVQGCTSKSKLFTISEAKSLKMMDSHKVILEYLESYFSR